MITNGWKTAIILNLFSSLPPLFCLTHPHCDTGSVGSGLYHARTKAFHQGLMGSWKGQRYLLEKLCLYMLRVSQ